MRKIVVGRLLLFSFLVLLIGAALAGGIGWLNTQGVFELKKVAIHQVNRSEVDFLVQKKMSNLKVKLENLKGQSLLDINLKGIRDQILSQPWVSSVVLSRHWPEILDVSIRAKDIETVLFNQKGELNPVVEGGVLLGKVESSSIPDLVVLRGSHLEGEKKLRQRAIRLLRTLPEKGLFTKASVSDIEYNRKDGFWLSLVGSGTKVIMGQGNEKEKVKRVSRVLEYMDSHKVKGRVIDARFSKKVLVKLRKGP